MIKGLGKAKAGFSTCWQPCHHCGLVKPACSGRAMSCALHFLSVGLKWLSWWAILELKCDIARKDLIWCSLHVGLQNLSQWCCAKLQKPVWCSFTSLVWKEAVAAWMACRAGKTLSSSLKPNQYCGLRWQIAMSLFDSFRQLVYSSQL